MTESAHFEDGRPVPIEEFDYSIIEKNLFSESAEKQMEELSQEDVERAVTALRMLLQWVWQNGMKNADGIKIRSIIICWVFLKELRPMSLTELARGFGLKKQSVGRWVDQYKRRFSRLKTSHMR